MNWTLLLWLAAQPPNDSALLRTLADGLADDDRAARLSAAAALAEIGPRGYPFLLDQLHSPNPRCRAAAAYGLGLLGAAAANALTDLAAAGKDTDRDVRRHAFFAIGRIHARLANSPPLEPPPPDPVP